MIKVLFKPSLTFFLDLITHNKSTNNNVCKRKSVLTLKCFIGRDKHCRESNAVVHIISVNVVETALVQTTLNFGNPLFSI